MMREDVTGVTVHLDNGASIDFEASDISVSESTTETGGAVGGQGSPVRYLTIICQMSPVAKGQKGGI